MREVRREGASRTASPGASLGCSGPGGEAWCWGNPHSQGAQLPGVPQPPSPAPGPLSPGKSRCWAFEGRAPRPAGLPTLASKAGDAAAGVVGTVDGGEGPSSRAPCSGSRGCGGEPAIRPRCWVSTCCVPEPGCPCPASWACQGRAPGHTACAPSRELASHLSLSSSLRMTPALQDDRGPLGGQVCGISSHLAFHSGGCVVVPRTWTQSEDAPLPGHGGCWPGKEYPGAAPRSPTFPSTPIGHLVPAAAGREDSRFPRTRPRLTVCCAATAAPPLLVLESAFAETQGANVTPLALAASCPSRAAVGCRGDPVRSSPNQPLTSGFFSSRPWTCWAVTSKHQ